MSLSKDLNKIFDQFWEWRMERTPEFASLAGDRRFGNKIERFTIQRFKEDLEVCKKFKEEVAQINSIDFNADDKINMRLFNAELNTFIDGYQYQGFLFPINFFEGVHVDFQRLSEWMNVSSAKDYEDLLNRYKLFPSLVDDVIETLEHAINKRMVHHKISMKNVVQQINVISKSKPECSPYFEAFKKMKDDVEGKEKLKKQALEVIETDMLPAMRTLAEFLESKYIPNTRPEIGATTLPNGVEFYKQCIKFHTSTNLSAKEIHEMGLNEVERITKGILSVMDEVGMSKLTIREFFDKLRSDKRFFYLTPEDLMKRYKYLINDVINPNLTKVFWNPPELPLEIVEVPAGMAGGPGAYYISGTFDGSRPGRFYVNTARFDSQPSYGTISLALHEGNPGHHYQAAYSLTVTPSLPKFRQLMEDRSYFLSPSRFPINTAFAEGWALYCESLGYEQGIYDDPYDRLGHFSAEMFRALRLVVDTGMHSLGWSRTQAIDYMLKHCAASPQKIEAEIDRYITWPGQALGYKVGEIKIKEMRKRAETKLGGNFNVKDFHEVVLKSAGPLEVIDEQVEEYIKQNSC